MGFMNSNLSKAVAADPYETYKTEAKKKLKEMSSSVSLSALSGTGEQAASLLSGSAGYKKPDITAEQQKFMVQDKSTGYAEVSKAAKASNTVFARIEKKRVDEANKKKFNNDFNQK